VAVWVADMEVESGSELDLVGLDSPEQLAVTRAPTSRKVGRDNFILSIGVSKFFLLIGQNLTLVS